MSAMTSGSENASVRAGVGRRRAQSAKRNRSSERERETDRMIRSQDVGVAVDSRYDRALNAAERFPVHVGDDVKLLGSLRENDRANC